MSKQVHSSVRESQINSIDNISFVRWDGEYKNCYSKAICRCCIDGFEWSSSVTNIIDNGRRCPQCSGKRRWTASDRIKQVNEIGNIEFVGWRGDYVNVKSKAMVRCGIDGYEWVASVNNVVNNRQGCPQCAGVRRWTASERISQINAHGGAVFVRWAGVYKNAFSKAVIRCEESHEWESSVDNILRNRGCPYCANHGYDTNRTGTLYALRSECGSMVKIGISNNHNVRHKTLKRKTPFNFECIELCHGYGAIIKMIEGALHEFMIDVPFDVKFDGSSEWKSWDDRIYDWFYVYRSCLYIVTMNAIISCRFQK